jgi:hypothetical protein
MSGTNDPWWSGNGPPPPNVIIAVLAWLVFTGAAAAFNMVSPATAVVFGWVSLAIGAVGLYRYFSGRSGTTAPPK